MVDFKIGNASSHDFVKVDTKKLGVKLDELKGRLSSRIIGQKMAVDHVIRALQREKFKDAHLPVASFLFAGPSGVGKTETAKEIARHLIGDDEEAPILFIDCNTLSEPHSISKLIGSPPGYIGSNEPPLFSIQNLFEPFVRTKRKLDANFRNEHFVLCQKIAALNHQKTNNTLSFSDNKVSESNNGNNRNTLEQEVILLDAFARKWGPFRSVILFDELEKASHTIWTLLLNILSEGKITLNTIGAEQVLFKDSIIVLTTNVGSKDIQRIMKKESVIGFDTLPSDIKDVGDIDKNIYKAVKKALEKYFPYELLGRLKEDLVVFRPFLDSADRMRLVELHLQKLKKKFIKGSFPVYLDFSDDLKKMFAMEAISDEYGARVLNQKIAKYIVEPVCAGIESAQIKKFNRIIAHYSHEKREMELFTKPLLIEKK